MHAHLHSSIPAQAHPHPLSHKLIWGAGISSLALTLAPYVLPAFGIGSETLRFETDALLHTHTNPMGIGLAGAINTAFSALPWVGAGLSTGVLFPIAASAVIGIGGVLFANWLEKRESGETNIRWSSVIRTASLATSALIALPSLLTGITTGLSYLALTLGDKGSIVNTLYQSLGIAGGHSGAVGILGATVPHLFLCGASLLPVGLSYWMKDAHLQTKCDTPSPKLAQQGTERSISRLHTQTEMGIAR